MAAKSTLSKSMLHLVVKTGETAEGKDVFRKIRVGFLDPDASDDALFTLGSEIEKVLNFEVQDIVKENTYTVEQQG